MLGESSSSLLAADSGSDAAAADGQDGGGVVERESGDRGSFGGNRWPRQETLELLKIRSEMDVAFRDSSSKGPLWEEVSRKLAELGYHRSAKKCKEKFENVYKYHKRTREGRTGKQDGKNYRFFDQLEAFDSQPQALPVTPPAQQPRPTTMPLAAPSIAHVTTTSSTVPVTTTVHHINTLPQNITTSVNYLTIPSLPISNPTILPPMSMNPNPATNNNNHPSFPVMPKDIPLSNNSTSSSTFSDEGLRAGGGGGGRKRKRKWKDFFERLMREVMDKQEELQARFLEAIEKREHERIFREDSWRMQEMARINKERELLAQERSMAAAKDTAVMAFLQKLAEQQNPGKPHNTVANNNLNLAPSSQPPTAPPPPRPEPPPPPVLAPQPPPTLQTGNAIVEIRKTDNGDNLLAHQQTSSSRWPKVEVQALIQLRTNLDSKYQENGPKGPLWEEISGAMKRLGYDRSAKRCKEKWENINKYFKKVKESNKKRRDDAKTCPYFQQLDAIYKERSTKNMIDMTAPLMVTPEQQWHPQQDQAPRSDMVMDDIESDQMDHNLDDDPEDGDGDGDGDGDEDEDDGGEFEVVAASKPSSNGATQ